MHAFSFLILSDLVLAFWSAVFGGVEGLNPSPAGPVGHPEEEEHHGKS